MRKPSQILKSTIATNAALIRERQWFVDYLYTLYNSLKKITQDGKDSGVVDLAEMEKICKEIGSVVNVYDRRNAVMTGVMKPPKNAKELSENTDLNIIASEYSKDLNETLPPGMDTFIQNIINDMLKMPPKDGTPAKPQEPKTDNQDQTWGEWKFFKMPQHDTFNPPPPKQDDDGMGFGTYGLFDEPPFDSPPPPPKKKKPKKDLDKDAD